MPNRKGKPSGTSQDYTQNKAQSIGVYAYGLGLIQQPPFFSREAWATQRGLVNLLRRLAYHYASSPLIGDRAPLT